MRKSVSVCVYVNAAIAVLLIWVILLAGALVLRLVFGALAAVVLLLAALILPWQRKRTSGGVG